MYFRIEFSKNKIHVHPRPIVLHMNFLLQLTYLQWLQLSITSFFTKHTYTCPHVCIQLFATRTGTIVAHSRSILGTVVTTYLYMFSCLYPAFCRQDRNNCSPFPVQARYSCHYIPIHVLMSVSSFLPSGQEQL